MSNVRWVKPPEIFRSSARGMQAVKPSVARIASIAGLLLLAAQGNTAWAIAGKGVDNSFLNIAGVDGSWPGQTYEHWVKVDGRYWMEVLPRAIPNLGLGAPAVSGPPAPFPGQPNKLGIALDKSSPDLPTLMKLCTDKTQIPEVSFAEPASKLVEDFPPYWEYKLKNVQIGGCDRVEGAPEQAFIVSFQDIEWLNYDSNGPSIVRLTATAEDIPDIQPISDPETSKQFIITWFGPATLGDDADCSAMNTIPTEEDYYALLPKDVAEAEKARRGEKPVSYGGPDRERPLMEERGPNRLDVCALPGSVPDPGHIEPSSTIAQGVNLDGDDGSGDPAEWSCKHTNFTSVDGKLRGVDNQLYRVYGCVHGLRGKKGYLNQTHNARRADGNVVTLVEISGIDDPVNDDAVEIALFWGQDKPIRSAEGEYLPYSTFRLSKDPLFARFNQRVSGSIKDGFIVSPSIKKWQFNNGQGGNVVLNDAQFRLQILPDGNLHGVVGGYVEWTDMATTGSYAEYLGGYSCPAIYQSFKRNADGMKDPVTGECAGISTAYEMDAVPAFIAPFEVGAPAESRASTGVAGGAATAVPGCVTIDNTLSEIAESPGGRQVLESLLGQLQVTSALQFSPDIKLQQVRERYPDRLSQEQLDDAAARFDVLCE